MNPQLSTLCWHQLHHRVSSSWPDVFCPMRSHWTSRWIDLGSLHMGMYILTEYYQNCFFTDIFCRKKIYIDLGSKINFDWSRLNNILTSQDLRSQKIYELLIVWLWHSSSLFKQDQPSCTISQHLLQYQRKSYNPENISRDLWDLIYSSKALHFKLLS